MDMFIILCFFIYTMGWLFGAMIPRSTRLAIQNAFWHRIFSGSHSNAPTFKGIVKGVLVVFGLLILLIRQYNTSVPVADVPDSFHGQKKQYP